LPRQIQFSSRKKDYECIQTEERRNSPKNIENQNDNLDVLFSNSLTSHFRIQSFNESSLYPKKKFKKLNSKGKLEKSQNVLLLLVCISTKMLKQIISIAKQNRINYLIATDEKEALIIHKKQIQNGSQIYDIILEEKIAESTGLINEIVSIDRSNNFPPTNIYVIRENFFAETKERILIPNVICVSLQELESLYSRRNS